MERRSLECGTVFLILGERKMFRLLATTVASAAFVLMSFSPVSASIQIAGDSSLSTEGLGDFTLDFTYAPSSATEAVLTFVISNTSPLANGGYLTALAFGNPSDKITELKLASTTLASFNQVLVNESVSPFGDQDFATSSANSWIGGGSPTGGIAAGNSATVVLDATGTMLDTITEQDFLAAISTGGGGGAYAFIARFRGFEDDGSDKVPGVPVNAVPEAGSLIVWGTLALTSLCLCRRKLFA